MQGTQGDGQTIARNADTVLALALASTVAPSTSSRPKKRSRVATTRQTLVDEDIVELLPTEQPEATEQAETGVADDPSHSLQHGLPL